jgi:hypothetical protein
LIQLTEWRYGTAYRNRGAISSSVCDTIRQLHRLGSETRKEFGMKRGKTLVELAQEIQRQSAAKADYLAQGAEKTLTPVAMGLPAATRGWQCAMARDSFG